jgi:two-component sensor histidine kinase
MQIRNARSDEARRMLRRVQDRVSGLATIHRHLYTARNLATVPADELLGEIVDQLVAVGDLSGNDRRPEMTTEFAPVEITPDQSVPLSLLLTEAATNAVKYTGAPAGRRPWIEITLRRVEGPTLCLSVVNARPAEWAEESGAASGLGSRLIESFATQLGGRLEIEEGAEHYALRVTFDLAPSEADQAPPDLSAGAG